MKTAKEQLDIISRIADEEGVGGVITLLSLYCKTNTPHANINSNIYKYKKLLDKTAFRASVIEDGWQPCSEQISQLERDMSGLLS